MWATKNIIFSVLVFGLAALSACRQPDPQSTQNSAPNSAPDYALEQPTIQRLYLGDHLKRDARRVFRHQQSGDLVLNNAGLRAIANREELRFVPAGTDLDSDFSEIPWWASLTLRQLKSEAGDTDLPKALLNYRGPQVQASHGRMLIHRMDNRAQVVEQTFQILKPQGSSFSLTIDLAGPLRPNLVEGALILSSKGRPVLRASAPRAFDAQGTEIPARFQLSRTGLEIRVSQAHYYPILIDPAWESLGEDQQGAWYGWSVSSAGDVNRDGFDDVVVAAPFFNTANQSAGKIYLYYGQADGLADTPAWQSSGDDANRALFGWSVAAGDVNHDGYSDLIVGAPSRTGAGKAFVFHGSFNGPLPPAWTSTGDNQSGAYFGTAVASASDVNNDGFDDVIVGAPAESFLEGPSNGPGKAFLYLGASGGLSAQASWTSNGEDQAGAGFGWAVAPAGDVNNDGFSDVVVGANLYDLSYDDTGRAYLFLGSSTGLSNNAAWADSGDAQAYAQFGSAVTGGDFDNDLYSDVAIGAPGHDTSTSGAGRTYAYRGGNALTGVSQSYWWVSSGDDRAMAQFGWSLAGRGDINDDGFDDLLIGSPGDSLAGSGSGRAQLYNGSVAGPLGPPSFSDSGDEQTGAAFGGALAVAGDVNNDGADDLIIGAYMTDGSAQDSGKAFLYLGSPGGGPGICEPPGTVCDDGQDCTHSDACNQDGVCAGQAFSCDDANVCTDDLCRPDGSCSYLHNQNPCDDGDPCTENDTCTATQCSGSPMDCSWLNDGCKQGLCDPASGQCLPRNASDGTTCEDNDPCTSDSSCVGGVCVHRTYTCGEGKSGCGCASSQSSTKLLLFMLAALTGLMRRRSQGKNGQGLRSSDGE